MGFKLTTIRTAVQCSARLATSLYLHYLDTTKAGTRKWRPLQGVLPLSYYTRVLISRKRTQDRRVARHSGARGHEFEPCCRQRFFWPFFIFDRDNVDVYHAPILFLVRNLSIVMWQLAMLASFVISLQKYGPWLAAIFKKVT